MPELPEVETVVRHLAKEIPGRRVSDVEIIHSDLLSDPPERFRSSLIGSVFESVDRRGKNIVISLSRAESPQQSFQLIVNLGMTGQLLLFPGIPKKQLFQADRGPSHPAIVFSLDSSSTLVYADVRRFGSLRLFSPGDWLTESKRLGSEPLDPDLTPDTLREDLRRSRAPIRSWLLDQTHLAGIGNIYAVEALFRAGIHPRRAAQSLDRKDAEDLLVAIRAVLSEAIAARGTTLRDFRTATGGYGGFGPALEAYGRAGEPCPRCNTAIERLVFGNRSAFFCPECQKTT